LFVPHHSRRVLILTYHRVLPHSDSLRPSQMYKKAFERQMNVLQRRRFNVLSLREAYMRLHDGTLPSRAVVITFDDGYADNLHVASKILKQHGFPAVVFVAPGFLNGGRMWNDSVIEAIRATSLDEVSLGFLNIERLALKDRDERRMAITKIINKIKYIPEKERNRTAQKLTEKLQVKSLPENLMMTDEELRMLHGMGIEIGGHTVNHPILSQLPLDQAKTEIAGCRDMLASKLDTDIRVFAYPNGSPGQDYRVEHVAAVRDAGFDLAVSTAWGPVRRSDDPLQLPRVGFDEFRYARLFFRLMRSYWDGKAARVGC